MPQLRDAKAPRPWPAITTHNHDNHGVRTENWRFIQYANGSEEFYDMRRDPNEWTNLVDVPAHADRIRKHRELLPKLNRDPAPGSSIRLLTYKDGKPVWEGKEITPGEPIPEI